ncbi:metal homeostatis protein bsd2 [Lactarius psammicola]|nr:metal homeostatis protein bsd2 [Lactarius psammicola]
MAPAQRYAPLPNPQSDLDAEREMDDAFDDDDHDNHAETTPLTFHQPRSPVSAGQLPLRGSSQPATNAYDFERDYDLPPPGSPPSISALAFPNNYGNSNGELPTSPVARSPPQSIFRRTFGALLPQYYQRIRNDRPRGGGTDNDGVFANVTAKPAPSVSMVTDDGDVYMVPEETQQEAPPSYVAASADAAPSYWDTTVHAPSALDLNGDMLIDELPTGSVVVFVTTTLISWFFQLPGFVLTYLLHGSHAGRLGSQAGLALTLIQFGFGTTVMSAFSAPPSPDDNAPGLVVPSPTGGGEEGSSQAGDGFPHWGGTVGGNSTADGDVPTLTDMRMAYAGHEWISFLLMTIGWFLLLTSMIGYFRVKRFEMSVRASRTRGPPALTAEDIQRDIALRRNLEEVFGISVVYESEAAAAAAAAPGGFMPTHGANANRVRPPLPRSSIEMRLENDLRAAGLL